MDMICQKNSESLISIIGFCFKDFNCDIEPDGKVVIKGISTTGEKIVCKNFQIFHMQTQNLCLPGPFTVTFQLPGPVNNQEATSYLANGMLEAIVKKIAPPPKALSLPPPPPFPRVLAASFLLQNQKNTASYPFHLNLQFLIF
ncbi:hypothetical protein V6N13_082619 [Hibiscus sabdariffa]